MGGLHYSTHCVSVATHYIVLFQHSVHASRKTSSSGALLAKDINHSTPPHTHLVAGAASVSAGNIRDVAAAADDDDGGGDGDDGIAVILSLNNVIASGGYGSRY